MPKCQNVTNMKEFAAKQCSAANTTPENPDKRLCVTG